MTNKLNPSRREAIRLLAFGFAAGASRTTLAGFPGASLPVSSEFNERKVPPGHIHALGVNPLLFATYDRKFGKNTTVLSSLELASGKSRQTLLQMAGGHAAMVLNAGRIACIAHHEPKSLVLDQGHAVIAELTASPGNVFGGHGYVCHQRGLLILPQRPLLAKDINDYGSFRAYDLTDFRAVDEIASGGLHPHEIHSIPDTDELAVTHYGDINAQRAPFQHNVVDAKLTILDAKTFRPKRHYPLREFNAMVTHMRIDNSGWAYLVLTQYISWPQPEVGRSQLSRALAELERVLGHKPDFHVPPSAVNEELLSIPLPMVRIHTQTGEQQIINAGNSHHLRSQSVAYNEVADAVVATYFHSDCLVIAGRERDVEVIDARALKLRGVRGVAEIQGTPMIAVMAEYRGISIYDLSTHRLIDHRPTTNYGIIHAYYDRGS